MLNLFCFVDNKVDEVSFKLLIPNIDAVEKLFKIVFVAYTDKSGLLVTAL